MSSFYGGGGAGGSGSGGTTYKGAVDYFTSLPSNAKEGDIYTVRYAGTSGEVKEGSEYIWGKYYEKQEGIVTGVDELLRVVGRDNQKTQLQPYFKHYPYSLVIKGPQASGGVEFFFSKEKILATNYVRSSYYNAYDVVMAGEIASELGLEKDSICIYSSTSSLSVIREESSAMFSFELNGKTYSDFNEFQGSTRVIQWLYKDSGIVYANHNIDEYTKDGILYERDFKEKNFIINEEPTLQWVQLGTNININDFKVNNSLTIGSTSINENQLKSLLLISGNAEDTAF